MNDIQKELGQAFSLLSGILVSGDGVDMMAAAREHLRRAFQLAGEGEKSDG